MEVGALPFAVVFFPVGIGERTGLEDEADLALVFVLLDHIDGTDDAARGPFVADVGPDQHEITGNGSTGEIAGRLDDRRLGIAGLADLFDLGCAMHRHRVHLHST